jgi:hypothetical protein
VVLVSPRGLEPSKSENDYMRESGQIETFAATNYDTDGHLQELKKSLVVESRSELAPLQIPNRTNLEHTISTQEKHLPADLLRLAMLWSKIPITVRHAWVVTAEAFDSTQDA